MISYYFKSDEITTLTKEINLTTADNQNRGKGKKKKDAQKKKRGNHSDKTQSQTIQKTQHLRLFSYGESRLYW